MNAEYGWVEGARSRGLNAQTIGEELERVRQRSGGVLIPEAIVKAARAKRSPLHPFVFGLDDAAAVVEHRLERARYLIRHVQVTITNGEEVPPVRAFVNVAPDSDQHGYSSIQDVLADSEMTERYMAQALDEMKSVRRRYGNLQAVAKALTPAIEVVEKELEMAA